VLALEACREMGIASPKPWQIYIVSGVAFQTISANSNIF
jgi:hypothetical protein